MRGSLTLAVQCLRAAGRVMGSCAHVPCAHVPSQEQNCKELLDNWRRCFAGTAAQVCVCACVRERARGARVWPFLKSPCFAN